ncbi:MAG: protein kinase [Myxococcales bacterium]|nr:protein kinase [Myxococcales bacterium]
MTDNHDLVGKIVGGRFEVVRAIGQGGMGTVFEARHLTLPRKFAIKILRRELANNPDFVERFRREAIAAARIEHPNVIYITDYGRTEERSLVYLVMEYLEGIGLDEVLSRNIRLPLHRALPILAQLADALDHAHQMAVVHRDLKPENILLTEVRGQKDYVKILDFGIAKVKSAEYGDMESLTMQGQVFGTAEYMSPEQATGEPTDGRSDIYALGCLAYEMITGNPPFLGPAVRVLQAHVNDPVSAPSTRLKDHPIPPAVDALILRCLAKEPVDRYQSGAELRQDLLKTRATLYSMSAERASRERANTGSMATVPRKALTDGWQALGGRVPSIFADTGPMGAVPSSGGRLSQTDLPVTASPEQLHDNYHVALRQLAIGLVQEAVAGREISEALERLLVIEEEVASLTGTIALSEQNFDRIRFEFGQREKRLRYAMLDLNMSRAQIGGRLEANPAEAVALQGQMADLEYQISELTRSTEQLAQERQEHIDELDGEVKRYREVRDEREQEAVELYQALHTKVEALRSKSGSGSLTSLYGQLDTAVSALEASHTVR